MNTTASMKRIKDQEIILFLYFFGNKIKVQIDAGCLTEYGYIRTSSFRYMTNNTFGYFDTNLLLRD